jgi:predicted hydrolase (HD superfamily)
MMPRDYILRQLESSSHYHHAVMVSRIMKCLAEKFGEDAIEWELVGLLHNLNRDIVHEGEEHGYEAAESIKSQLSEEGREAIQLFDFRSQYDPGTRIGRSLVFADSLAKVIENKCLGPNTSEVEFQEALEDAGEEMSFFKENIERYAYRDQISVFELVQKAWNPIS